MVVENQIFRGLIEQKKKFEEQKSEGYANASRQRNARCSMR
jgi:hypothetical protein